MLIATSSSIGNIPATALGKLVDLSSLLYREDIEEPVGGNSTTAKMRPVFALTGQGLPALSSYSASRRNWLSVSESGRGLKAGSLRLTWRLESYDAGEVLKPASKSVDVPPFPPAAAATATRDVTPPTSLIDRLGVGDGGLEAASGRQRPFLSSVTLVGQLVVCCMLFVWGLAL
jgi:hypothetical protein